MIIIKTKVPNQKIRQLMLTTISVSAMLCNCLSLFKSISLNLSSTLLAVSILVRLEADWVKIFSKLLFLSSMTITW